jgi:ABC-type iron transport system FetAB permease component
MAPEPRIHSVGSMSTSITLKRSGLVLAGVAAINALALSPLGDQGFFAIALLGPIATGIAVGLARGDARLAAAAWAATGVSWLVFDWIVNQEDVAFHAILALVMAGLVALGALIGRSIVHHARVSRA